MRRFAKEERVLRQLQDWGKKHLRMRTKVNYNFTLPADKAVNKNRNGEYRHHFITKDYEFVSDTAQHFSLGTYGETIKEWLNGIGHLISVFRERRAMREQLEKFLRDDVLYDRMEQVFYELAAQMLHLLSFCQYDRIANDKYREMIQKRIAKLLERAQTLLEYYGSYLSLQGSSAYADETIEIDRIQIAVESMQETLEQSRRAF